MEKEISELYSIKPLKWKVDGAKLVAKTDLQDYWIFMYSGPVYRPFCDGYSFPTDYKRLKDAKAQLESMHHSILTTMLKRHNTLTTTKA